LRYLSIVTQAEGEVGNINPASGMKFETNIIYLLNKLTGIYEGEGWRT
jgi:hypothetical protein